MLLKSLAALCLLATMAISTNADYCTLNCGNTKNIACNSPLGDNGWGESCKDQKLFDITEEYQNALVDVHNKYRNLQALGNIKHYDPAVRMAKMRWDPDLAYTAGFNVRTCIYGHDGCHNTANFSMSGQNIAMMMTSVDWDRKITTDRIADISMGWFNEYKNGEPHGWMNFINELKGSNFDSSLPVVGHFTQWVQDKAEAVGCAAITSTMTYNGKEYGAFLLTCNYSWGNLLGSPVYVAGETASKCTTGTDKKYPGLCSEDEDFSY